GVGLLNAGAVGQSTVCAPPTPVITGAPWSSTEMVWLAVLVLPQLSVAVQVRFTTLIAGQVAGSGVSAKVRVAVPQASLAVGELNDGDKGQFTEPSGPTPEMVGAP